MRQPDGLGLAEAVIASGDCFVECGARASLIRDALGATLVDMETAAVAQVAQILGLPWCAIKAATDEANQDSADDFHANLTAAARRAAEAAERAIGKMAG
jgi:nucleoside phosphorylase